MITLYPAIDLKGGECVRLWQGDMEKVRRFNENPAAQAASFAAGGAALAGSIKPSVALVGSAMGGGGSAIEPDSKLAARPSARVGLR
ncbi:MAG: HisA/HisF-related TIM barrel protein, partial [Candidatus Puniceispirillaceae bacterium]